MNHNNNFLNKICRKIFQNLPPLDDTAVHTSIELVNEICSKLEKLPNNPKIIDPACGRGTFLVWMYEFLFNHYYSNIYDIEEKNYYCISALYGCEINKVIAQVTIKVLKQVQKYYGVKKIIEPNIYVCDFLEKEFIMKFDVALGNPPYHELDKNGRPKGGGKGGCNNLWSKFFIKSKEIADNVLFIHPPSFLSPNHIVKQKMFEDGGLKFMKIFEKSPFDGVGTQACYYYWSKNYNGLCQIGNKSINLNMKILPNSSNPLDFAIFNKFFKNENSFKFKSNSNLHKTNKKHLLNDSMMREFKFKTYHGSKIVFSSICTELYDKTKVIVSDSGYLNPILDINCNTTQHSFYFLIENESEGENLVNILKSNLYDYCLTRSKFSGFFNGEVLKNIPKIDLTKVWTNKEIYEYFNLSEEEIEHIEKNVK